MPTNRKSAAYKARTIMFTAGPKKVPTPRIAELQDLMMIELSNSFNFILHGGTAIWRVYSGKRFSYVIDVYHNDPKNVAEHFSHPVYLKYLSLK
ncbi:MAG: hypothetical protein ACUVTL_09670 [Thermoproteota archaeon]